MTIVASEIVEDAPQADGRRWVRERHTDQIGAALDVVYLADADADAEAIMATRVPVLDEQMRVTEVAVNVVEASSKDAPLLTFNHSTQADLNAALRERYRVAEQVEAVIIGAYFSQRPDAEIAAVFDVSGTDLTDLRSRFDAKLAMMQQGAAAAGE